MSLFETAQHFGLDTISLSFILLGLLIPYFYSIIERNRRLPPGPYGYPFLGIIPLIKKEFHLLLFDYSNKFGKILSLKMGGETVVVLSDYHLIKEAFRSRDFVSRPKTELSKILGGYGVINSEGHLWKSQRSYLLNQKLGMRHWNTGNTSMEQIECVVRREVIVLLETLLEDHVSKPVNLTSLINCAVSNVICSIIMSTRFHHKDPKFKRFMFLFDEGFRLFTMTGAMTFLPVLKVLPGISNACSKLQENRQEMLSFVRSIIQDHKTELDEQNPRDLIDSYLIQIQQKREEGQEKLFFPGYNPEEQLEQILLDLFSASVETLKASFLWSIVFMLNNTHVLKKVQNELTVVVGNDRLPEIADMTQLHYTKATLYEIMRRSSVVPMGTTHATERDVHFEGYVLPRNSHVIPLLHAVHNDPKIWKDPEEFKPERFLNSEGSAYKPQHFIPFGIGQRMCLGDSLAERELFLLFSSFLHVFDLSCESLPSLKGIAGVTVSPTNFDIICTPRNISALLKASQDIDLDMKSKTDRFYG